MNPKLQTENELLLENNHKLTSQLAEMTEKLHDGGQKLQSLNFSLAEQKVSYQKEVNKNRQTIEILNQRIEQLENDNRNYHKDNKYKDNVEPISEQTTVDNSHDEASYKEINDHLKEQMRQLIEELETKLPLLQALETSNKQLKENLVSNVFQLETISTQNQKLKSENTNLSRKLKQSSASINSLQTKCKDLSSQVQTLLCKDQNTRTPSNEYEHKASNSQQVISSALVNFKNVQELQTQNIKLLTSIRELTAKFETETPSISMNTSDMQTLQEEIDTLKERLEALTTENSSYKSLIVGNKLIEQQKENESLIEVLKGKISTNERTNKKVISELNGKLSQQDTEIITLNDKLSYVAKEKENLVNEVNVLQSMNRTLIKDINIEQEQKNELENKYINEKEAADSCRRQYKDIEMQLEKVKFQLSKYELDTQEVLTALDDRERRNQDLQREIDQLRSPTQENSDITIFNSKSDSLEKSKLYNATVSDLMEHLAEKEQIFEKSLEKADNEIKWLREQLNSETDTISSESVEENGGKMSEFNPSNATDTHFVLQDNKNQVNENDPTMLFENLQREKNKIQNESVALKIEVNLLKKQLELLESRYNIKGNTIDPSTNEALNDDEINEKYANIVKEINDLAILKNELTSLSTELQKALTEKSSLITEKQTLQNVNESTLSELQSANNELQSIKSELHICKEELNKWKAIADGLSSNIPEEIKVLSDEVEKLKSSLQNEVNENNELEARFSRLKKQAHEKLDASKATTAQLTLEVNELTNKQADLENVITTYKEMEREFENKKEEVSKMQQELNFLQGKLDESTSNNDVEERIKTIQKDYELKQNEMIEKITSEMKSKYQTTDNTTPADIDKMREEWENETLARIEEAKESLKKHIRLPSEEKIKKVIDKRKAELENEFDQRVEEKANALKLSEKLNKPANDIQNDLEQKIKARIEENFTNTLKKKIFEEGKHQASMRTTLLERKIAKLEAQLEGIVTPGNNTSVSEQPHSSSKLSKINIDNPFNVTQSKLKPENKAFSTLSNFESPFIPQDKNKNPFSSTNSPMKDGNDSTGSIVVKKPSLFNIAFKPTTSSFGLPHPLPNTSTDFPFALGQKSEDTFTDIDGKRKSSQENVLEDVQAKRLKSTE